MPSSTALAIPKEIEVIGSGHALAADLVRLVALMQEGKLAPRIAETLPIDRAARGHEILAADRPPGPGRLVLVHESVSN